MTKQKNSECAMVDHIEQKVDLLLEGHEETQLRIEKVSELLSQLIKEFGYKVSVLFDELHIIRDEVRDKVGREEFNTSIASLRE